MTRWIALFRGINVGGNHLLPMKKLVLDLQAMNLQNVKTYIQSGNVVFDSDAEGAQALASSISERIQQEYGFRPKVLLLTQEDVQRAIDENPFPDATTDHKTLHFFFLEQPASNAKLSNIEAAKSSTENYALTDRVFYLHAPDGIGVSKLATVVEKNLGVTTTARNYRTVEKLISLATE